MEERDNIIINQVDPSTFEYQQYTDKDTALIASSKLDTTFTSSTDYIEYYAYGEDQSLIFPAPGDNVYQCKNYKVINGDVFIYPSQDLENLGYEEGSFFSTYNFYRKRLGSSPEVNYYIDEISGDRTEVRLKSNVIENNIIITSSLDFIQYRTDAEYFVDFLLNFGSDQQVICNNIDLDNTDIENPSVLVKLYEPLPENFGLKDELWIVEEISSPQAYNVEFPEIEFVPNDFQVISGPNYSIQITQQSGEASQEFNFDTLIKSDLTSSYQQLKNVLDRKEIDISVDYTDYNNFIYFSSALSRIENFYSKVGMIQSSSAAIAALPIDAANYSSSKSELTTSISTLIANFDGWEYFMYFNSGSEKSYPKSNTEPPYILEPTQSATALDWLGSADPSSPYYGGQALSASNYDEENDNYLYNAIPEYLRDDTDNQKYILFVDMVAQQYDNTWLYTKNITTRFDADNRLDFGISKDLVADAIRDFGVKLYSNNFNTSDLYTAFLGLTPSGSTFPFPEITGSFPTPSGFEYVNTEISASNDIVPLDNVNKSLYKRIYHNIPYLLKTKGTTTGLKALITSYGIPDTILRINEFGGKDRNELRDWDYSENVYNYALHLNGENSQITSSFVRNTAWPEGSDVGENTPKSIQFRFKTPGIPTASAYYNLAVGDANKWAVTLEYTGSGMDSGSYSGSVPSQSNAYGTLKFWADGNTNLNSTCSIDLPYFDGGWWSVMATIDYDALNTGSLFVANKIGEKIGFSGSDSVGATSQYFKSAEIASFPSASGLVLNTFTYLPLTGALQEVRYWDVPLSESLFYDYVVNPYSTQGNTINKTPDTLVFRADLGTELNTGSRESIHPKITGSWVITQSFANDSNFFLSGSFIQNTESIYLNQVPGGIKNRITDKIKIDQEVLPTGSTLSPYRSIQQSTYPSGSSPSINYLEVAFSPTDQTNDDIIAQIGAFNLGDYIGDPRQISESGYSYPQLDALRDAYFTKYINSYDVVDFVRLIKFFDNSLFKMIEDFTPARTTLSSGVVIKQNLLERNRQAPPSMSFTTPEYSGSVKSFARDYQVPNSSTSYPQDGIISGSSIQVFRGGTGGVFEPYNSIFSAPISQSATTTCLLGYFFTSSNDLLDPNENVGETVFSTTVGNTTNTMSINVEGNSGQNYTEFLRLVHTASLEGEVFVEVSSGSVSITHQIDTTVYFDGYGVDDYGVAPYGDYTNMFEFYLTVTENNPPAQFSSSNEIDICFTIKGEPYSGKTAAEVSASSLFSQYPDFQQTWSESIVPSLGITPPYKQSKTGSNQVGPVNYPRIDQREFYNGEFGNAIQVGANEICDAFFGQDAIIDYFFRIQWFDSDSFSEENFLSINNLPLAGNVWMWTDVSQSSFTGIPNGQNLNITQQPFSSYPGPGQGSPEITASLSPSSTTGTGTGLVVGLTQSFIGNGPNVEINAYVEETGSGYVVNEVLDFDSSDLIAAGFNSPNTNQTLKILLGNNDIVTTTSSISNKVKYIKISNADVNGVSILPFIQDSDYITLNLTGAQDYLGNLIQGYQTWYISNSSIQDDNNPSTEDATLLIINQEPSSDAVTSYDSLFYDLTFSASGVYSYYATASGEDPNVIPSTGVTQSVAQGYFPPIPTFPTESFFRGWAKSNYFEGNPDGTVYRVDSGSGFSTDTLGNFNTGSVEMDFDSSIPYTGSKIPWFMNAPSSTLQVLDNSSLVGNLGTTDLQLYTGSITASAVPIGPSFTTLQTPTPVVASNILIETISVPTPATLFIQCQNLTNFQQVNYFGGQITITATDQTLPWSVLVNYLDGSGWVTLSANSGTGDAIISVNVVNDQSGLSSPLATRTAIVTVQSLTSPTNNSSCTVTQQIYDNTGYIPPNPNP